MSTATTTCTCSPDVPWDCENCYTAKRDREVISREALAEVRRLKAQGAWLLEHEHTSDDAIPGTDIYNCVCETLMPPTGIALYREALAYASRVLAREQRRRLALSEVRTAAYS
jgi:hypothetical protein